VIQGRSPADWLRRVTKSVSGLGTADPEYIEHSPVLLTSTNVNAILTEVERAAPAPVMPSLKVLATSAVMAHDRYEDKVDEAEQEVSSQRDRWNQFTAGPLEAEFVANESERQKLIGIEASSRAAAAEIAARKGMRFYIEDFASLDAFQDAIDSSCHTSQVVLGNTKTANLKAKVSSWLVGLVAISPLCLCVLTTLGLMKLLFGIDIGGAMQSPMTVLAMSLALGVTVPVLVWAYRLGWLFATVRESKSSALTSIRSGLGLVLGLVLLLLVTAFFAGIDALAVQALVADMAQASRRQGLTADVPSWMPWIGLSFTFAAVMAKAWLGYSDSVQDFQDNLIASSQQNQVDQMRLDLRDAVILVAKADFAAARLVELQPRQEELAGQLGELKFEAEFSDELVEETATERDTWIGESNRFWAVAWSAMTDPTMHQSRGVSNRPRRSLWQTLFRRFGR